VPHATLSWPFGQLLSARKYIISHRIVSYRIVTCREAISEVNHWWSAQLLWTFFILMLLFNAGIILGTFPNITGAKIPKLFLGDHKQRFCTTRQGTASQIENLLVLWDTSHLFQGQKS